MVDAITFNLFTVHGERHPSMSILVSCLRVILIHNKNKKKTTINQHEQSSFFFT